LLSRGYRRIACIAGPEGASTSDERLAGYRAALQDHLRETGQGRPPAEYVCHGDFRVEGGRAAMERLLELPEPPDAVFVANNLMTVGALAALRDAGREPPRTGLLSFGDVPWPELVTPSLTSVQLPSYELGFTAAGLLQERLAGVDKPLQTVVLRTSLQARESTGGPVL
ncbi:substrate-binding domain-containing protein, partial [Streptomyces sp. NPDC058427]